MTALLFSCENATCAVPEAFRELFRGSEDSVTSSRGWEPGSLNLAQAFAMKFRTPLVHGDVTRLLLDFEMPRFQYLGPGGQAAGASPGSAA